MGGIGKGALALVFAAGSAASVVAVRLDRALDSSERNLAGAEERIRQMEREEEAGRGERARLTDELRGLKGELALLRAALTVGSGATSPEGGSEPSVVVLEDASGEMPAAMPSLSPEQGVGVAPDLPPPDPEPARRQREELFGAHAPAVEAMLTLHAEERFEELAAVAEEEIARDPSFTFAWVQGGLAYARLGAVDRARQLLTVARDRSQDADPRLVPYYRAGWFALEDVGP